MRGLVVALLLFAGIAQADEGAIRNVIDGQITAFRAENAESAFTFAAPNIKGMFGTPERFGQMVRQGYPMVWQPGSVEYLDTRRQGSAWTQDVLITDAGGRLHKLEYTMVELPDGWKIAGVRILTEPEVGA